MSVIMWEMSIETAEEFYWLCMERKAETEEERMQILLELANAGKMQSVIATERSKEQIAKDLAKNFGDVLWIEGESYEDPS